MLAFIWYFFGGNAIPALVAWAASAVDFVSAAVDSCLRVKITRVQTQ